MTYFQILTGCLILLSMILRPIAYKSVALYFSPKISAAFTSTWLMVGLLLTAPFFGHLLTVNFLEIIQSPYLLLSVLKGFLLFSMIEYQQIVNKKSTSSSVFFGFIALALGSFCNNIFFNEGLAFFQLMCVFGLGFVGLFFFLIGDAKRLSSQGKICFIMIVFYSALFNVTDHLAIPAIGWYAHLLISSFVMFLGCFAKGIHKTDFVNMFCNKYIVYAGFIYTASEFLIIYASTNILPVSFVAVFMRLAAPVVMVISAFKYKEQTWTNQLIFGIVSIALALPLILIKT